MNAALTDLAHADGVTVTLIPAGSLKIVGDGVAVAKWTPSIHQSKAPGASPCLASRQESVYWQVPRLQQAGKCLPVDGPHGGFFVRPFGADDRLRHGSLAVSATAFS